MYFNTQNLLSCKALDCRILIAGVVSLMIAGCASSYVVLLENPDGTTGEVIIKGQKGDQVLSKAHQGALLDGSTPPAPVSEDKLSKDFGDAMAAQPRLPVSYLLYFKKDVTLTKESKALIPVIVAEAADRQDVDISVIGHTDTVARAELNERLSHQRAQKIIELLED